MAFTDSTSVLGWLKAAGEDSRLRLLALCAGQELSVSDLAEALRQSEPRVSRHLKILCDAGLLERMRQGQWVHYRVTQDAAAAGFVRSVLGQMDRNDPLFALDRDRAARPAGAAAAGERTLESRLGRALKGFVEVVDVAIAEVAGEGGRGGVGGNEASGSALVVGVEHLELLEAAVAVAGRCVAIAHSRRAAQSARTYAERRGLACRVLLAASPAALCERDIEAATERSARESPRGATERSARESPRGTTEWLARESSGGTTERLPRESPAGTGAAFDVVFLDHLARPDSPLDGMLDYGRRALAANGRLWVFERYEALAHGSSGPEAAREKVVEHPIGRLRRLLGDVGLRCERLSPIETDGQHVIAAVAVPSRGVSRGTGTGVAGAA